MATYIVQAYEEATGKWIPSGSAYATFEKARVAALREERSTGEMVRILGSDGSLRAAVAK